MKIIVCIKQVPETGNVKMDPGTGTMVRAGVESIVNPLDLYAIEAALQIKEARGGTVTAVSMGPRTAAKAVKEAISMGCDDGLLVSAKEFAGSDTHATAYALSRVLLKLAPFDVVFTGVRATDGDTGQVGPGLASFLDVPILTDIRRIAAIEAGSVTVERLVENGVQVLRAPTPCVISVVKEAAYPRLPTLRGKQEARATEVPVLDAESLGADTSLLGLQGSPTRVVKIERPRVARTGKRIEAEKTGAEEAAKQLADFLEQHNLL